MNTTQGLALSLAGFLVGLVGFTLVGFWPGVVFDAAGVVLVALALATDLVLSAIDRLGNPSPGERRYSGVER